MTYDGFLSVFCFMGKNWNSKNPLEQWTCARPLGVKILNVVHPMIYVDPGMARRTDIGLPDLNEEAIDMPGTFQSRLTVERLMSHSYLQ